jgi:hypothetical protein
MTKEMSDMLTERLHKLTVLVKFSIDNNEDDSEAAERIRDNLCMFEGSVEEFFYDDDEDDDEDDDDDEDGCVEDIHEDCPPYNPS